MEPAFICLHLELHHFILIVRMFLLVRDWGDQELNVSTQNVNQLFVNPIPR
jgi:hypothetical protein